MASSNNAILLTKTLDPEIIKFGKVNERNCTVYYPVGQDDYEKLRIQTPKLRLCFDPQFRTNKTTAEIFIMNLTMSLELIGTDKNKMNIEMFEAKIRRLERTVQKILPPEVISGRNMSSSFYQKGDYAPTLRASIRYKNGDPVVRTFKGKEREPITIDELKRGTIMTSIFLLDNVWITNDKYGINWIIEQTVVNSESGSEPIKKNRTTGAMIVDE
jgi:hypothetical protein